MFGFLIQFLILFRNLVFRLLALKHDLTSISK